MAQMIKLVFADYRYIILSVAIFVGMLIPLSIISEFIFFEPYIIAQIPSGGEIELFLNSSCFCSIWISSCNECI